MHRNAPEEEQRIITDGEKGILGNINLKHFNSFSPIDRK